jgi:hypothetical protein
MGAVIGGGYGEKREMGRETIGYDPWTELGRQRAVSLFSAPETIPRMVDGAGGDSVNW